MNRMILVAVLALGAFCTLPPVARAGNNGGSIGFGIGLNLTFSASSTCNQSAPADCGYSGCGSSPAYNPYMGSPYGMSSYGGYPMGGYGTDPSSFGGFGGMNGMSQYPGYGVSQYPGYGVSQNPGYGMSQYPGYGYGNSQGGYEMAPLPKEVKPLDKPLK